MENAISFNGLKSYIGKYGFFGKTAKRENVFVTYSFKSYMYTRISLSVKTMKLDSNCIPSPKIVNEITLNGVGYKSWTDFIKALNDLTRYNGNRKYKKDYKCHKPLNDLRGNDAKSIRVLRKEARQEIN